MNTEFPMMTGISDSFYYARYGADKVSMRLSSGFAQRYYM